MYGKAAIPSGIWIAISAILVFTLLRSPNFLIMTALMLYIPYTYKFFYVKGNPNVIFWGLLYQWLTVSIQAIYCSFLGISINDLFAKTIFPSELFEYTDFLSVIGLYVITYGIFRATRRLKVVVEESIWDKYNPQKILQTYILVSVVININQVAIWAFPTLVQYFYFFFYIKWGFFMITFISIFKRAPHLKIFLLMVIIGEFILGLSSYFSSSFANILLFSIISYSAVSKKIPTYKIVLAVPLGILLFHIAVLWTAAKGNYRSYVSQGQNVQTVKVSKQQAREKLFELIIKVDENTYNDAVVELINRIGYIQYFAAAIRYVPAIVSHEYGRVYWAALSHYLVPRFINPDKPELDDSKHTNQYTGLNVSGKARASSFSLGTFADAYIDFGPVFMFTLIFLFGYVIGFFFQYLYSSDLWGLIFTGPFFLLINIYGSDTTKAIGFLLIYFLVMFFLKRTLRNYIDPMMLKKIKYEAPDNS